MRDDDALRQDFPITAGLRRNEAKGVRFRVRARDADTGELTEVDDFTNYEFTFYLLAYEDQPLSEALWTLTSENARVDKSDPPYAAVTWGLSDWTGVYADLGSKYEFHRTDTGNERCIAYGDFPVHRGTRR